MLPKRLEQARPFLVLGVGFLVWLFLPTLVKRLMRASFFEFQAPLEATTSAVRDVQDYWALRTRSKNDLIEAGKQLANLNAQYETRLREYASLENRVERLEALLRLPSFPDYKTEVARVVRRDFNAWWQRLVIRKGRNYDIPVGAPVIFVGGVVGRVSEVGAYTAVVDLISSPSVRIAAKLEGDVRPISFQGGINPAFGPARGVVEFVPLDVFANTATPKRLVTSGLGGIFPDGLNLGEIVKLEKGGDGLFQTGEVQLDPRLLSVSEVAVLVPLGPKGNEK
ncbi:MAG TPA: rod shape-determining protein MreC [Opitutaceae bacterium]|nr:rod shape-determining protein MreC [Opitutaceae bacterium]